MLTTFCPQCGSKKNFRRSSCGTVQPCKACGHKWEMPYPGRGARNDATGLVVVLVIAGGVVLAAGLLCAGLVGLGSRGQTGAVYKPTAVGRGTVKTAAGVAPLDTAQRDAELARIREAEVAAKLKAEREAEAKRLAEEAAERKRAEELAQRNEASAVAKLKIAVRFLEENGNKEMARKKASEVIEQYPDTKAATEAKAFIAKLGK